MADVDLRVCAIAIDGCSFAAFEKFVQAFHADVMGSQFVPLGGVGDGGADGFDDPIFEASSHATSFMQASKTPKFEQKIRQTIRRIRDFGRDPRQVTFYFSVEIQNIDIIEQSLSDELSCAIRIRSKQYIISHVNRSVATRAAFRSYIAGCADFVSGIGSGDVSKKYPFDERTLCTFLGQELESRSSKSALMVTVTDALILWALEGTDPEKGLTLNRAQIKQKITSAIPSSSKFIGSIFDRRLEVLSSKGNPTGREISWYKKDDVFALRFDQREALINENIDDFYLKTEVRDGFIADFLAFFSGDNEVAGLAHGAADACHRILEEIFSSQGLSVSLYALGEDVSPEIDAREILERVIDGDAKLVKHAFKIRRWADRQITRLLYAPNDRERSYMRRLSRTYFLLFILKNDPHVVEYFNSMTADMTLLVGSDLLIRAISEYYLDEDLRESTNALRILKDAGARLILTDMALEEVYTHIVAADAEFKNYYMEIEPAIDEDRAIIIDRILIRAYFYAKLKLISGVRSPRGWMDYMRQFVDYSGLHTGSALDGFRVNICSRFGLEYETREETRRGLDEEDIEKIKLTLIEERGEGKKQAEKRALNDALNVLRVYKLRSENREQMVAHPFGYRTWWLSHERAVLRVVSKVYGVKKPSAIMRPEFLLNYIAISPTKKEVADSYRAIFPSSLGIELGRRLDAGELHDVLRSAREAYEVDEHRARAMLSEYANKIRSGY